MRLTIATKIISGFAAICVLMLFLGLISLWQASRLSAVAGDIGRSELPSVAAADKISYLLSELRALNFSHLLTTDADQLTKLEADREGLLSAFEAVTDTYSRELAKTPAERDRLSQMRTDFDAMTAKTNTMLALSRGGQKAEAARIRQEQVQPVNRALIKQASDLVAQKQVSSAAAVKLAEDTYRTALAVVITVLLLGLLASLALALLISRPIARNVALASDAAARIARGELDVELAVRSKDELGDMARSFHQMIAYLQEVASTAESMSHGDLSRNVEPKSTRDQFGVAIANMIKGLRDVVTQVRTAAESVGAGALQLSSSSSQLSGTVSAQASSAEETSATIVEMTANIRSVDQSAQTVGDRVGLLRGKADELAAAVTQTSSSIAELAASIQEVAGNVAHANQASDKASEAATHGERAVSQTIDGMNAISETMTGIQQTIRVLEERSSEIGAIIEVIDDIAEQTNLLALNAAIEAARAGEAGRGFAVVADEVRKLAERSAKATREIGTLIKGIQQETAQAVGVTQEGASKVVDGVRLANNTNEALQEIRQASMQVSTLLNEVAMATSEQARASSQIVTSSEQMAAINQDVTGAVVEMNQLIQSVTYATAEQRQGTDQVVRAIESLSHSSQEAATATEQVSATASDLKQQAQSLQSTVAFFQLDEGRQIKLEVGRTLALPAKV